MDLDKVLEDEIPMYLSILDDRDCYEDCRVDMDTMWRAVRFVKRHRYTRG
jgi:hypothetical protein